MTFSREEMREIFTAALLHDFGKISIPERVLVKAKKIEEDGLRRIRDRFDYVARRRGGRRRACCSSSVSRATGGP